MQQQPIIGRLQRRAGGYAGSTLPSLAPVTKHSSGIGSLAGGILGDIAGTALLPGLGTVAGGGAGSALGEALEELLTTGHVNAQEVGAQGALGLAGGAAGKVLGGVAKGVKAAKTINIAGKAPALADAIEEATTKAPGGIARNVSTLGQQMEARSGGFGVGAKATGQAPLDLKSSTAISKTLSSEGIKAGNPLNRLRAVEDKLSTYGQKIDQTVQGAKRPLTTGMRQTIANQYLDEVKNLPGVDESVLKNATNLADNFVKQAKDTSGLINFRRGLDNDVISYVANPDAATSAKQAAAKTLRETLRGATNDLVPGVKSLNDKYHNLIDAKGFLVAGGKSVNNASGGIAGRILESGPVQSIESHVGKGLQAVAGTSGGTRVPGILGRLANAGVRQGGTRLVANALQPSQASPQAPESAADDQTMIDPSAMPQDTTDASNGSILDSDTINGLVAQALSAPDAKTQQQQLSLVSALLDIQSKMAPSSAKPVSSATNQQIANATSGLKQLGVLQGELQRNPNLATSNAVASILPGAAGNFARGAAGTQDFNTARNEIVDVLARLRTGAAISKQEESQYKSMLPSAGDSPSTVTHKIAIYQELFQGILDRAQGGQGTATSDLVDSLSQQ